MSQEYKSTLKTMLIVLGLIGLIIGLIVLVHDIVQHGINTDQSQKQLIKDLPCNWLKLDLDNNRGMWILDSNAIYEKQVYQEKCTK